MVMALRRKKKCFLVRAEAIEERLKRLSRGLACKSILLFQDPLGICQIVSVADALQDKIETMDRGAVRREKCRHGVKAVLYRARRSVFENGNGKDRVERPEE